MGRSIYFATLDHDGEPVCPSLGYLGETIGCRGRKVELECERGWKARVERAGETLEKGFVLRYWNRKGKEEGVVRLERRAGEGGEEGWEDGRWWEGREGCEGKGEVEV